MHCVACNGDVMNDHNHDDHATTNGNNHTHTNTNDTSNTHNDNDNNDQHLIWPRGIGSWGTRRRRRAPAWPSQLYPAILYYH